MQARLRIKHDTLETVGTCSLTGMLIEVIGPEKMAEVKEIILEFEEVSIAYCRVHNGPKMILMPDFVPHCFLDNILHWIEQGISVKTTTIHVDK